MASASIVAQRQSIVLRSEHFERLTQEIGLTEETIRHAGLRSATREELAQLLGFDPGCGGIVIPYREEFDKYFRVRLDVPYQAPGWEKPAKYLTRPNSGNRVYTPPGFDAWNQGPLVITEGEFKAMKAQQEGIPCIALAGVWAWKTRGEHKEKLSDARGILKSLRRDFGWKDRPLVALVFDSDIGPGHPACQAFIRLGHRLRKYGAERIKIVTLPSVREDGKTGLDDFLGRRSVAEFWQLVAAAPSLDDLEAGRVKPAEPKAEILAEPPARLTRPLALMGGDPYLATWVWTRVVLTETLDKRGFVIHHDPPLVKHERTLVVLRGGKLYGPGGDVPLSELGVEIALPEALPDGKILSATGLQRARRGERVSPAGAFERIVGVIDHFIDFDRSLASQRLMCELVACWIMGTWLAEAFNVLGYLWVTGDKGAGKTTLLTLTTELSYLGQIVLAGGSYPALRDLADLGGMLGFDNAEAITDNRKVDPDKIDLLLAGARRGATIPVKEATGTRGWKLRFVNAFCPRAFSAVRLPADALATRSIVIPLVRSSDREKTAREPLDFAAWPCKRDELIDDLWLMAYQNLPAIAAIERQVSEKASLSGRLLDPWKASLAVALWLDQHHGVRGLFERLDALSTRYQGERQDLEVPDFTTLVVAALCHLAAKRTGPEAKPTTAFEFTTADVLTVAGLLAKERELPFPQESITGKRVGRVLSRLRLRKAARPGGAGSRRWTATISEVSGLASAYGLPWPPEKDTDDDDLQVLSLSA